MIVVADAGPLHYLILIGWVDVLPTLYGRVVVPQAVSKELQAAQAPNAVRMWISHLPDWCTINRDILTDLSLTYLDPGERAAIHLAASLSAERLLIDEWRGRIAAQGRKIRVVGTVGVLAEAHRRQLLDFETSIAQLRKTNFYISENLISLVRRQLSTVGEDV